MSIRAAIITAINAKKLSSYGVSKITKPTVSEDTVRAYVTGRRDITTEKADSIISALKTYRKK